MMRRDLRMREHARESAATETDFASLNQVLASLAFAATRASVFDFVGGSRHRDRRGRERRCR